MPQQNVHNARLPTQPEKERAVAQLAIALKKSISCTSYGIKIISFASKMYTGKMRSAIR
jgi:hypothetical protein